MYLMSSPWRNAWLRVQERKKGKKVELREEKAKTGGKKGKDGEKGNKKMAVSHNFPQTKEPNQGPETLGREKQGHHVS